MKNIELLSGDVVQEKVKAKNFPYVAFSPKENTVYYTSAPEPDQIIYTTLSGASITPNLFMCDLVEMSNTYNDTKTAGCILFEAPITHIASLQSNSLLTSVIIPEGVETIEEKTFYRCNNLSKVVLPKSIKHIGSMAFCGTKLSPEAWYQVNTPIYIGNWLLSSVEEHAHNYSTDVYTVKYGTVGIGPNTFKQANVNKINLPDTVKVIDDSAFQSSTINEICLPSALEVIGKLAFCSCDELASISIPDRVTSIGEEAFWGCSSLTSIVIPDGVTSIGSRAFFSCSSIASMVVAEGNTVYDSRENCNAIIETATNTLICGCQNTTIPNSVTSIGEEAFCECSFLNSIIIPDNVTSIEAMAFLRCPSLTSVVIGNGVTSLDNSAFWYCSSLTSVTINSDAIVNKTYSSYDNIPSRFGSQVTEYIIGDSVTSIGDYAFYNCSKLQSVTIPNGVASIGEWSFYGGSKLASMTIPESVTSIGNYAFKNCSSLTAINVDSNNPNYSSVDGILFNKDQTALIQYPIGNTRSEYTIPNSVTSIGYEAFYGCSLDTMYFQSYTPPATMENALSGSTIAVIYVPHSSLEEYKASPLLKDHISKVVSGYVPETCTSLTATASDIQYGLWTTTTIAWEAVTSGHDRCTGELVENVTITGTSISDEFELNLSETESIERTIPFTYLGTTVECTFTQGPYVPPSYTIDLNDSWELLPTNSNPNIEEYDGVYQSFSNKGQNNTAAIMYLDLFGYDTFTIFVRSYGEAKYDYIMVGQPNKTITNDTSYSDTSLVKAHTRNRNTSSTALSSYTAVIFTGLDNYTKYRIPILYRKDSSGNLGDDRGYLLIPKNL